MRFLAMAGLTGLLTMTLTAPALASGVEEQWSTGPFTAQVAVRAADVNGDGLADLVSFNTFRVGSYVLLSNGNGYEPQRNWGAGDFLDSGFRGDSNLTGDVDNDGRDDLIAVRQRNPSRGIWVAKSGFNHLG